MDRIVQRNRLDKWVYDFSWKGKKFTLVNFVVKVVCRNYMLYLTAFDNEDTCYFEIF
jgi:hypothetical protein